MEKWKNISNRYEISSTGKIRNIKKQTIRKTYLNKGYQYINFDLGLGFGRKHYSVHRLVCEAFLPNPENKKFINHIDADPLNNNLENLEWCTQKENLYHCRHITRNGKVISLQKVKYLYEKYNNLSLKDFISMIEKNAN